VILMKFYILFGFFAFAEMFFPQTITVILVHVFSVSRRG